MRETFILVLGLAFALAAAVSLLSRRPEQARGLHELGWSSIPVAMLALLAAAVFGRW